MPRTKTTTPKVKEEPNSKIKVEPDLCEIKVEEFQTPSISKKIKVSRSRAEDSTKLEESKLNYFLISSLDENKSKVLGKRSRKMKSKQFIDDEAEESDGELKEEKREINTSDLVNCK